MITDSSPVRPVLAVDVDGMLFPTAARRLPSGFQVHSGPWDNVALHPDHGRWLRDLSTDFDLVWASMREDEANQVVAPALGLPDLPVIRFSAAYDTLTTYKWADVSAYAGRRPLCWLDDEFRADAAGLAARRAGLGLPTLLLAVDPAVGFTAGLRDQASAFARRCAWMQQQCPSCRGCRRTGWRRRRCVACGGLGVSWTRRVA